MLLAALGIGVFAAYVQLTPSARRVSDDLRRPSPNVNQPVKSPSHTDRVVQHGPDVEIKQEPQLLVATTDGDNVKLVPASGDAKGQTPAQHALNESFRNLKLDGVRVLAVQVEDGVATVDANGALLEGMGSAQESTVLKAIQMTLGQFDEIQKFQIRVEGQVIEELGHFEISEPLAVIRVGKTEPDGATTTKPSEDPPAAQPR